MIAIEEEDARFIEEFRAASLRIVEIVTGWEQHGASLTRQLLSANDGIPPGANVATRRSIAAERAAPAVREYAAGLGREVPTLTDAAEDAQRAWEGSRTAWRYAASTDPDMVKETRRAMDRMRQSASFGARSTGQLKKSLETLGAEIGIDAEVANASRVQDVAIDLFESIEGLAGLAMGVLDSAIGEGTQ